MGPVLSAVGFTQAGVAAGSIAAGVQSAIGSVSAGSAFAVLQSIGAAGLGMVGAVAVPVAVPAAVRAVATVPNPLQLCGNHRSQQAVGLI